MLIEGNMLSLGGPRAVQGYFLAGDARPGPDGAPVFQRNLTIRDNIYYGSSAHGISLTNLENAVIERNTVLPSPHTQTVPPPVRSEDGRRTAALVPRIRVLGDISTGVVRGNIAPKFAIPPGMQDENNLVVSSRSDGGKAWRKVFATPPTGDDPPLESFLVDPKSAAGKAGQGARAICGNLLPPAVEIPSGLDPSMTASQG
jgi:parallel beta-helix repeat protein